MQVKSRCSSYRFDFGTIRARSLLEWRSKPQARAAVRQAIEISLDKLPPEYDEAIYATKCDAAYRHVYNCYYGGGQSLYAAAAH